MSHEVALMKMSQLARYYHQSLTDLVGRKLTWIELDVLRRFMKFEANTGAT